MNNNGRLIIKRKPPDHLKTLGPRPPQSFPSIFSSIFPIFQSLQGYNPFPSTIPMAPKFGALFVLLFIISIFTKSTFSHATNGSEVMLPVSGMQTISYSESRRRLGSFKICGLCTCCGGPKRLCLLSPCCYAIRCNIPNRPFGFCSLIPKYCNCFGCHL